MEKEPQTTRQGKKQVRKNLFVKMFIIIVLCILDGGLAISIQLYAYVQAAPKIEDNSFDLADSSTMYNQNDELIAILSNGEERQLIKVEDIPQHVQDAFIAIEDVRFYEHSGLDLKRIGGAVLSNIMNGFGSEGGSTITQQVVKNSLLNSEKSIKRKVQEAYLALELEKEYTKDEILELYLNKIYFGNGVYGIEAAAGTYFEKSVDELTIEEAALLAGLPQRPSSYDPFQAPEQAEERRNTVMHVMKDDDFITDEEYRAATNVSVEEVLQDKRRKQEVSDAFMDQVYKELESIEGIDASMLYNGGLEIYTTYDQEAQEHVDEVLNSGEFVTYPDERFQAGVTLIDNRTGEIKAIGGGRNQEPGKSRANYATNIQRSPGSTIKPILDYGAAIEYLNWSTYQQIEDEEITYTGSEQVIRNYNGDYHGIVSMREALTQSWNIPAVKTFKEVGSERAREFAANVGLTIEGSLYESYALGSFKEGISPLELAGAYAAFGNEGIYNEPHVVRKVVFPDGKEINMQPQSIEAMRDSTAYMVTDMLQTVVEEGTGILANIEGVAVAGKTGTTNFNEETKQKYNISEGVPDVWFAGYTSNYTAAVWTGYRQVNEENYIKTREHRQIAQQIFREVMVKMVDEETNDFQKPDSVEEIIIDTKTGERATESSHEGEIVTELFVSGTTIQDAYSLVKGEWEQKQAKKDDEKHSNVNRGGNKDDVEKEKEKPKDPETNEENEKEEKESKEEKKEGQEEEEESNGKPEDDMEAPEPEHTEDDEDVEEPNINEEKDESNSKSEEKDKDQEQDGTTEEEPELNED
ncbi:PBP1A family penicillin-binding protein [Halalkalibacter kiskunsagensis]|uniref:PBP1A family penicillin-binding protein n=1 Tax=Halalkalibacter kiskunsagensis TaxID=1548599 RepID=A0ABV6KCS8_9BACI